MSKFSDCDMSSFDPSRKFNDFLNLEGMVICPFFVSETASSDNSASTSMEVNLPCTDKQIFVTTCQRGLDSN